MECARGDVYKRQVYELEQMQPFLDDLYAACEVQGLPVRTAISEYAPGQLELTLDVYKRQAKCGAASAPLPW